MVCFEAKQQISYAKQKETKRNEAKKKSEVE
jgi:hypothetical protein